MINEQIIFSKNILNILSPANELIKGVVNGQYNESEIISILENNYVKGMIDDELFDKAINELGNLLEKAGRDISKLHKKIIVDKNGVRRQVWVLKEKSDDHVIKKLKKLHSEGKHEDIKEMLKEQKMSQGVSERLRSEGLHDLHNLAKEHGLIHENNAKHEEKKELKQKEYDKKLEDKLTEKQNKEEQKENKNKYNENINYVLKISEIPKLKKTFKEAFENLKLSAFESNVIAFETLKKGGTETDLSNIITKFIKKEINFSDYKTTTENESKEISENFEKRQNELEKYISKEDLEEEKNSDKITNILNKLNSENKITDEEANYLNENAFIPFGFEYTKKGLTKTKNNKKQIEKKEKTINSNKFKNWFGDWELNKDKASKVVNTNNEPQENYNFEPTKVYHGTYKGDFDEFKKEKISDYNYYGKGFYFTEDFEIAKEYSTKTRDVNIEPIKKINIPKEKKEEFANDFINLHLEGLLPQYKETQKKALEEDKIKFLKTGNLIDFFESSYSTPQKKEYNVYESDLKTLLKLSDKYKFNPLPKEAKVFEVYLNIKKPINFDNIVNDNEIEDVIKFSKNYVNKENRDKKGDNEFYWKHIFDDFTEPDDSPSANPQYPYKDVEIPKNLDGNITVAKVKKMFEEIKKNPAKRDKAGWLRGHSIPIKEHKQLTWENLYHILGDANQSTRAKNTLTAYFKSKGYDGITHTGGHNIGTHDHKVWIAFEPNQIKSTSAKEFDINNNNIYKNFI